MATKKVAGKPVTGKTIKKASDVDFITDIKSEYFIDTDGIEKVTRTYLHEKKVLKKEIEVA